MDLPSQGIAKVQHYVPQFLLRNFGNGKKRQLHVFDKRTMRTFCTNVRNVAGESRFYDFEFQKHSLTMEPSLSELEGKAKPIFNRVIEQDSLSALTIEDQALLSVFFSLQYTRTRWFREQWRSIPELLAVKLRQTLGSEGELKAVEEYIRIPDENQTTMELARFMTNAPKQFAPHFADKVWVLLKTECTSPFMIGDNPLALQNQLDHGLRGNLGLAVRGIEIYFPLTPTRALALWCPSHEELFRKAAHDLHTRSRIAPYKVATYFQDPMVIEQTIVAIESGRPLPFRPDNVTNFNSLQIRYAERYVFANKGEFSLAREMVTLVPELRGGPRFCAD